MLKVPDEGEIKLLSVLTANSGNWKVRLFKNDVFPSDTDTVSTYTEADFSGYTTGGVIPTGWSTPTTQNNVATSTASAIQFQHNGGATANDIYGYFVVHLTGDKLLWAERLDMVATPVNMSRLGDTITITPKLTLSTEY